MSILTAWKISTRRLRATGYVSEKQPPPKFKSARFLLIEGTAATCSWPESSIIDDQSAAPTKSHLFTFAGENFAGHQITMGPFDPNEDFCALEAIPAVDAERRPHLEASKELLAEANLAIIANAEKILLADRNRAPCWSVLTSGGLLSWHDDNFYLRDEEGHVERLRDCDAAKIANALPGIPFLLQNAHGRDGAAGGDKDDDHCNVEALRNEVRSVERMLLKEKCLTPVSAGTIEWREIRGRWGVFLMESLDLLTDLHDVSIVKQAAWLPELISKARNVRPQPIGDIVRAIRIARGVPA